jgi:hypothetical protein
MADADDEKPQTVYHGTDAGSVEDIRQRGLDQDAWRTAGGALGVDEKGFSVTTNRGTAEQGARTRAAERGGPPEGVVLEADAGLLPLRPGSPGEWTDPEEFFIRPEDFDRVGPGIFR